MRAARTGISGLAAALLVAGCGADVQVGLASSGSGGTGGGIGGGASSASSDSSASSNSTASSGGTGGAPGTGGTGGAGGGCAGNPDTLTDPSNCGVCGNVCPAGVGAPTCAGGRCLITLVSGLNFPSGMVVDGNNAYWAGYNNGDVGQVPIGGAGAPKSLASTGCPASVAVDASTLYWADPCSRGLYSIPIGGGPMSTLISSWPDQLWGLGIGGGNLYVADPAGGKLLRIPTSGGATSIFAGPEAYPFAPPVTDATTVYWLDRGTANAFTDGTVMSEPMNGANDPAGISTLATGQSLAESIAVDVANIYWVDLDGGGVWQMKKDGTGVLALASGEGGPGGVATDGLDVYWTDYNTGTVQRTAVGGAGNKITLATGQGTPFAIAVQGNSVFWLNRSGAIVQMTPK